MANTTIPQVLHDVKVAYLTASGDTDTITYGNFATKVGNMGGGVAGGYKVVFKVEGNTYYVASCGSGSSISAPPDPSITNPIKTFEGWQIDGTDVSFPYTPEADVTMTANISSKNILAGEDDEIVTLRSGGENIKFTRENVDTANAFENGKDLCAYVFAGGKLGVIAVTKTAVTDAIRWTIGTGGYDSTDHTIQYNGNVYYYNAYFGAIWSFDGTDINDSTNNRYKITASTLEDAVLLLLAAYYE